jgi:hypothetical protein
MPTPLPTLRTSPPDAPVLVMVARFPTVGIGPLSCPPGHTDALWKEHAMPAPTTVPPCGWEHNIAGEAEECPACHQHTSACGWQWGASCTHPVCAA